MTTVDVKIVAATNRSSVLMIASCDTPLPPWNACRGMMAAPVLKVISHGPTGCYHEPIGQRGDQLAGMVVGIVTVQSTAVVEVDPSSGVLTIVVHLVMDVTVPVHDPHGASEENRRRQTLDAVILLTTQLALDATDRTLANNAVVTLHGKTRVGASFPPIVLDRAAAKAMQSTGHVPPAALAQLMILGNHDFRGFSGHGGADHIKGATARRAIGLNFENDYAEIGSVNGTEQDHTVSIMLELAAIRTYLREHWTKIAVGLAASLEGNYPVYPGEECSVVYPRYTDVETEFDVERDDGDGAATVLCPNCALDFCTGCDYVYQGIPDVEMFDPAHT